MATQYSGVWRGVIIMVALAAATGAPREAAGQGTAGRSTPLDAGRHWVGTWAATLVARAAAPPPAAAGQPAPSPPLNFNNQTLRQIVRVSIGGPDVRAVFSNAFGTAPLRVGAANIALREKDDTIVSGSSRPLLFSGKPSAAIAPGAVLVSDPVTLRVADLADVAVDVYLPDDTAAAGSPLAHHTGDGAVQTNYLSETGNHAGAQKLPVRTTTRLWHFLSRVEVTAPAAGRGGCRAWRLDHRRAASRRPMRTTAGRIISRGGCWRRTSGWASSTRASAETACSATATARARWRDSIATSPPRAAPRISSFSSASTTSATAAARRSTISSRGIARLSPGLGRAGSRSTPPR